MNTTTTGHLLKSRDKANEQRCKDSPSGYHLFGKWVSPTNGMSFSMCKWCSKGRSEI